MRAPTERYEELGFTLTQQSSGRYSTVTVTDTDFADDISLSAGNLADAQILLNRVWETARKGELNINKSNIEFHAYNTRGDLHTVGNRNLKLVDDSNTLDHG